jgi:hypothetical protein
MTVTLLSAPIRKNAFGAKGAAVGPTAASADARRLGPAQTKPMVKAAAEAAPAFFRKSRRVGNDERNDCVFMVLGLR